MVDAGVRGTRVLMRVLPRPRRPEAAGALGLADVYHYNRLVRISRPRGHTVTRKGSMASAVPQPTARLIFRTWDGEADAALAAGLWGDSLVTELIGGPFDAVGEHL